MGGSDRNMTPRGGPLVLAGTGAIVLGALIDRILYELSDQSDDVTSLFMYASVKRTLTTTGGVLLALGIALELARRPSS